ncbi:MAG TPA: hypothetical protein VMS93_12145 [Candidatus Saccharimonadales bacterium]|nr:hypothetical protein [Candidatus Saccharimonadales bacterium]
MPEGPEVETERLHEAIHEEIEREGGRFLKLIALTTAILAALAAVAALTRSRAVRLGSLAVGLVGTGMFALQLLR